MKKLETFEKLLKNHLFMEATTPNYEDEDEFDFEPEYDAQSGPPENRYDAQRLIDKGNHIGGMPLPPAPNGFWQREDIQKKMAKRLLEAHIEKIDPRKLPQFVAELNKLLDRYSNPDWYNRH